jgi:hypothetical protein
VLAGAGRRRTRLCLGGPHQGDHPSSPLARLLKSSERVADLATGSISALTPYLIRKSRKTLDMPVSIRAPSRVFAVRPHDPRLDLTHP